MDIDKIILEIIPPNDYQHRNGFSNNHLIDKLNDDEKLEVEKELISRLRQKTDMLIVETLAYMKSMQSLPILYSLLEKLKGGMEEIIVSVSIFEINRDKEMIEVAKGSFRQLTDTYQLIPAFYYLIKLNTPEVKKLIMNYVNHSEYLVSHNAKQALGIVE